MPGLAVENKELTTPILYRIDKATRPSSGGRLGRGIGRRTFWVSILEN